MQLRRFHALMILPLILLVLGALALTGVLAVQLVRRGLHEGHPAWVALGGLSGALWLAMCYGTAVASARSWFRTE